MDRLQLDKALMDVGVLCAYHDCGMAGNEVVDAATVAMARKFLAAWPDDLLPDSACNDPDGMITFSWISGQDHFMDVNVNRDGWLDCAFALGAGGYGHCRDRFEGGEVPATLLYRAGLIRRPR